MVIVHGFGGVSDAREGFWARELAAFGVAALVVESFTARGVGSSIDDQSRVSTAQGLRDAYAALGYLAQQEFVDPRRIGVMGMSWGGTVALRAADRRRQGDGPGFAASIPLYPGCVAQYRNPRPGVPLLVLIGERDDYTGIGSCVDYVNRIRAAGGAAQLKLYPGAHHGFDGDAREALQAAGAELSRLRALHRGRRQHHLRPHRRAARVGAEGLRGDAPRLHAQRRDGGRKRARPHRGAARRQGLPENHPAALRSET